MSEKKEHKINPVSKYYEGMDGVFYDFKHDEFFVLEYYGCQVYRKTRKKIVGKFYKYFCKEYRRGKNNVVLTGMTNVIRLGLL